MQITVSSEMANRMDDSNSTASLAHRERLGAFSPSGVTTVIQCIRLARPGRGPSGHKKKKGGPIQIDPPILRFKIPTKVQGNVGNRLQIVPAEISAITDRPAWSRDIEVSTAPVPTQRPSAQIQRKPAI
jgi:hypothetical protein